MTDIRMDIVDLLLDCEEFSVEAITEKRLKHKDGRPFTEEEAATAGKARRAELEAVRAYYVLAREDSIGRVADTEALATLTEPYFINLGVGATLGDVRNAMTSQDRERLDDILSRIAP